MSGSSDLFCQAPPQLGNQFDDDRMLRSLMRRRFGDSLAQVRPRLREMGELAGGSLYRQQLEDLRNEPALIGWDAWGNRVDRIELSPLWQRAAVVAAESGLVATPYEGKWGPLSRTLQFALVYLFHPSSDVYTCPLAMTDGAARTLLDSGNQALIGRAVPRLTSRDPALAWTSGQWMTEATGGSDVGSSETRAVRGSDGEWRLFGRKWFTSAATSEMALTLARPEGAPPGGRGLALFYLETRDDEGRLNGIEVCRLKDKLGTRKVPTAELLLQGCPARLVREPENGVRDIVPMLEMTRTWNSVCAIATMRRGMALSRDYARRRFAFGAPLSEQPLHLDTLAWLQARTESSFHLCFYLVDLIGRREAGELTDLGAEELRLLTSLTKLSTGREAVAVMSEVIESFGGAGYVEDTGLPLLLRDAQVLPIWEGTTNVLSLDLLRALGATDGPGPLLSLTARCRAACRDPRLVEAAALAEVSVKRAAEWYRQRVAEEDRIRLQAGARRLALTLGQATGLALLAEHAQWALDQEQDARPAEAAARLTAHGTGRLYEAPAAASSSLAMDVPLDGGGDV
jgi:alkylation response protein AidB-like acyl-CoA dehydrogenase